MTKLEWEQLQDDILRQFLDQPEQPEDPESDFQRVMLAHYRRAGPDASAALLAALGDAGDDGAYRNDLMRMARKALENLPTIH